MKRALARGVTLVVALAACGDDGAQPTGAPADGPRTIEITMVDIAYEPTELDVAVGETVTFVFRNDGAVRHEAVFGTLAEQEAHHAEMEEMDGDHDAMDMGSMADGTEMTESPILVVEPGETVELNHTFDTAGPTMIGCHEPGHWEAGMKIDIDVA